MIQRALTPGGDSVAKVWDEKTKEIEEKVKQRAKNIAEIMEKGNKRIEETANSNITHKDHTSKGTDEEADLKRQAAAKKQKDKEDAEYAAKQGASEAKALANAQRAQQQAAIADTLALDKEKQSALAALDKEAFDKGEITQAEYTQRKIENLEAVNALEEEASKKNIEILEKEIQERKAKNAPESELTGLQTKLDTMMAKQVLAAQKTKDAVAVIRRGANDEEFKDAQKHQKEMDALYEAGLGQQKTSITNASAKGDISDSERQRLEKELTDSQIAFKEAQRDQQAAILADPARTDEERINAIADYAKLTGEITNLKKVTLDYGDTLKNTFSDQLGKSILDLTNGVTNLGEAMKKVALSVVQSLQSSVTKNLGQSITKMITDNTGSGSGIFGQIAGMAGLNSSKPDGSPNNALWVRTASGDKESPVAKATDMVDGLKTKFKEITDGIESGFTDIFQNMGDSLTSIFNSLSSIGGGDSGGGGLFGTIASIFAADGGLVTGPGGPTSDSIPAMLSNGEHVTNAAQTKKWLPLLTAINSGQLDGMSLGTMGMHKFATGGLVGGASAIPALPGGGAGNQINNISIAIDTDNNAKSSGDGSKGVAELGKTISTLVVQELVRQKRPGGLLAS